MKPTTEKTEITALPQCRLCRRPEKELAHLNIYAFGSEGINVCNWCLCAISDFCRMLSRAASEGHKTGFLTGQTQAASALALAREGKE